MHVIYDLSQCMDICVKTRKTLPKEFCAFYDAPMVNFTFNEI